MVLKKPACDFLQLALKRKTCYEFSDKKIRESDLRKILEAGRWAPSSHNLQPWHFIVIKNRKTIESVLAHCYYVDFHSGFPLMIAIVLDSRFIGKEGLLGGSAKEFAGYHNYLNVGFAVSNMVFEANSLGIQSCIISPSISKANVILKVPNDMETVLVVGLGYELKNAFQKKRERKKLSELVSKEFYKT